MSFSNVAGKPHFKIIFFRTCLNSELHQAVFREKKEGGDLPGKNVSFQEILNGGAFFDDLDVLRPEMIKGSPIKGRVKRKNTSSCKKISFFAWR